MTSSSFNPTRPRPGRLVRLGIVIDAETPGVEHAIAITDASGVEVVWLADHLAPLPTWAGGWADLVRLARLVRRSRLGVAVTASRAREQAFRGFAASIGARLDITLPGDAASVAALRRIAPRARIGLSSVALDPAGADDVVIPASPDPLERAAEARARLEQNARLGDAGVALVVPVAIGRTMAEANARLARATVFGRVAAPRDAGLFGTLEAAQERVIALAHAGVRDLRCVVPDAADSHDMLAQLTAVAAGTTALLLPGAPRSPDPPPPEGWGGPRR